jgi:hypothetical protein
MKGLSSLQKIILRYVVEAYQAEGRRLRMRDGVEWGLPGMPRVVQIAASRALRRLEARGLLVRQREQGRTVRLELRPAGLALAQRLMRTSEEGC